MAQVRISMWGWAASPQPVAIREFRLAADGREHSTVVRVADVDFEGDAEGLAATFEKAAGLLRARIGEHGAQQAARSEAKAAAGEWGGTR